MRVASRDWSGKPWPSARHTCARLLGSTVDILQLDYPDSKGLHRVRRRIGEGTTRRSRNKDREGAISADRYTDFALRSHRRQRGRGNALQKIGFVGRQPEEREVRSHSKGFRERIAMHYTRLADPPSRAELRSVVTVGRSPLERRNDAASGSDAIKDPGAGSVGTDSGRFDDENVEWWHSAPGPQRRSPSN